MKSRRYGRQSLQRCDDDWKLDPKEEKEMSKSITPISCREVLIGGAAVAPRGFPFRLLPVNPNPRALPRRRNNFEETLT
jgi:hypothetical protein